MRGYYSRQRCPTQPIHTHGWLCKVALACLGWNATHPATHQQTTAMAARAQEFAADPQIKAAAEAAGAVSPGRNIALAACGDGVVPGKKQKQQLYPIVFQVLNLPPWARSRMENFIICTIIDGHKAHADLQPTMEVAMDELLWMYWEGVSMVAPGSSDTSIATKALLLDTRYDLPGLAQAFRLAGGNPYLGACPTCCQPGLRCGTKPIYPCESLEFRV